MNIKIKLFLTIIAIGALSPAVIIAHPGHGNAESNIYHYVVDHASGHYVWILLIALFLVLLGFGAKR